MKSLYGSPALRRTADRQASVSAGPPLTTLASSSHAKSSRKPPGATEILDSRSGPEIGEQGGYGGQTGRARARSHHSTGFRGAGGNRPECRRPLTGSHGKRGCASWRRLRSPCVGISPCRPGPGGRGRRVPSRLGTPVRRRLPCRGLACAAHPLAGVPPAVGAHGPQVFSAPPCDCG